MEDAPETTGYRDVRADASRRTWMALERTQLAWWRTGLTAVAVGLGVGRLLPELSNTPTDWPYIALGVAFAVYGMLLILNGTLRGRAISQALRDNEEPHFNTTVNVVLSMTGAALCAGCALVILFN